MKANWNVIAATGLISLLMVSCSDQPDKVSEEVAEEESVTHELDQTDMQNVLDQLGVDFAHVEIEPEWHEGRYALNSKLEIYIDGEKHGEINLFEKLKEAMSHIAESVREDLFLAAIEMFIVEDEQKVLRIYTKYQPGESFGLSFGFDQNLHTFSLPSNVELASFGLGSLHRFDIERIESGVETPVVAFYAVKGTDPFSACPKNSTLEEMVQNYSLVYALSLTTESIETSTDEEASS